MNDMLKNEVFCGQIAFLGETLGPFFLQDPEKGTAQASFAAMQALDPRAAGDAWPFVADDTATRCIVLMQEGLQEGIIAEDLVWEYRRLFIGPAKKPAPPWGSVYTDRECVVFGQSTLALRQWMRECGIERTTDENTPEDHIGLMLVLLAWLAEVKPEYIESYLANHLLTWSSHFLEELSEAAENSFYEGLAQLTKASLEGLQDALELSVEYPRYYR